MTLHKLERDRHFRLAFYAILSFVLTLFAYLVLGFDRLHALAYCVSAFALLNLLNYRLVLTRLEPQSRAKRYRS